MIAVLGALRQEIGCVISAIHNRKKDVWAGRDIVSGTLEGKPITAAFTGVGKVMASMTAQHIIDTYDPTALLFVGIGGALNAGYQIGDLVVARESVQHDFDVTRFGYKRGEIPYENIRVIPSTGKLIDAAMGWRPSKLSMHEGRLLTGDSFVGDREGAAALVREMRGDAVDMEGAAAAIVAHRNDVDFLLVRRVSDRADGEMPKNFRRFLRESGEILAELVRHIVASDAVP